METPVSQCSCGRESDDAKREKIAQVVEEYRAKPGSLIQILHLAQGIYGYLPLDIQRFVAERLNISLSEVYGVTTFYSFFSSKPRGEYTIRVCLGTACYVRGGLEVCKRLSQTLGISVGETTADARFTLEVMRCIGACGLAPALLVNDRVVRQVNPDKLNRVLALCG